jgi:hypothetical protein
MKRITIVVPDELNALLQEERRRRDVPAAEVVRDALEAYLVKKDEPRRLSFAALGRSGRHDISERVEEILDAEWGGSRDR